MADASRFFTATPARGGGVRLRFRDEMAVELDEDNVARSTTSTDQNGDEPIENIVHIVGPLIEGQSVRLMEQGDGTVAVILVSPPDEVLGDTVSPNSGMVSANNAFTDRRTVYRTGTLGGEAKQLADMNAINKAHYKR